MHKRSLSSLVLLIATLPIAAQGPTRHATISGLAKSLPVQVTTHRTLDGRVFAKVGPAVLELHSHSVRANGFRLVEQRAGGKLVKIDPGPVRTFRGKILGNPSSMVAGSILGDGLHARIVTRTGESYWIQPDASSTRKGRHVLYQAEDTMRARHGCGTDRLPNPNPAAKRIPASAIRTRNAIAPLPRTNGRTAQANAPKVAELACDADYEYYADYGSSSTSVNNRIESVINTMNLQYERDVNITHQITTVIVRTSSSSQPYTSTDAVTLLNQMRSEWNSNQSNVNRDVAHLFTGKNIDGGTIGIAWIGVICHGSYGYGLVESDFNNAFACATDLSAHELGHNWNAQHCGCRKNTMNSTITCANAFSARRTIPVIAGFRDSVSCLGGGGGTATSVQAAVVTSTPGAGKGEKRGRATVTITDNLGNPIASAQVTGSFSGGITEGPYTLTTNGSGVATFETTATVKGKFSLTFCVTAVSASLPWSQSPQVCDAN